MRNARRLVITAGLLVGLLLLALAALPFLLDARQFRPILQAQLRQRLHRPVLLGDMQLKVFPLAIRVSDAVIGQPEGFASPQPFLQAQEVYVGVALWPLVHKEVRVKAIRLRSPRIELIRSPAGIWNYETGGAEPADTSASNITLEELRVEDGQVALQDQKAATPRDVYEHIDLTLKDLGSNRRGSLAGSVRLDTMAAVLSVNSDFDNADAFTAKGTLTFKSDRNKDSLDVAYDLRRAGNALIINSLSAKIGALSATAAGSVDTEPTPVVLHLDIKTANAPIADLLRIAALYGARFPPDLKVDGVLRADVQITGTTEKPIFAGKIEATKAQITAKELVEPVRASELLIDLTPDSLSTQPFTLETGGTRLTAQATVGNYSGSSPKIDATLQTKGARVEELLRMASAYGVKPAGLTGTGSVNLDMKISEEGKAFGYSGSGSLREITLASPDLPKTLTVATADVKFSQDRIGFDHLQAALGFIHVDGTGSLRDFAHPHIQFDAHVDQLNVAELRELSGGSGRSGGKKSSSADKVSASGTLAVGKILYDQIALSNVKATVKFANGLLSLDPVTAVVFSGQEAGSITANLRDATAAYAIKTKLTNVDANQLLSSTTSLKGVLSGSLSGNVDLQFLAKPNNDIAKTLNGNVQIQMGQGRLAGVHILNEVASIGRFIGYTKQPEVSTKIVKLTGSLNIQNGLASTNDLFLDLGDGTLSGTGTMGLVDQSLKLRVTTVLGKDFAQKNIPGQIGGLLTTVLANQKGELVVPAVVTGTFAQPRFAPDAEQIASLKLRGLLPTASNPAAFTSGVKGIVDAFTGKKADAKANDSPQGGILDLIDQFRKKKPDNKP